MERRSVTFRPINRKAPPQTAEELFCSGVSSVIGKAWHNPARLFCRLGSSMRCRWAGSNCERTASLPRHTPYPEKNRNLCAFVVKKIFRALCTTPLSISLPQQGHFTVRPPIPGSKRFISVCTEAFHRRCRFLPRSGAFRRNTTRRSHPDWEKTYPIPVRYGPL